MTKVPEPSGFTLIELLVVIAIISMLASISIPQFIQYRKRATDAAVRSDLRNAQLAADAYYAEHGEYPSSVKKLREFRSSEGVETEIKAHGHSGITIKSSAKTGCEKDSGYASYEVDVGSTKVEPCK